MNRAVQMHPLPTLVIDPDGRLLDLNAAGSSITGVMPQQVAGLVLERLLSPLPSGSGLERFLGELKMRGTARLDATLNGQGRATRVSAWAWRPAPDVDAYWIHLVPERARTEGEADPSAIHRLAPLSVEHARELLVALHGLLPHVRRTVSAAEALAQVLQAAAGATAHALDVGSHARPPVAAEVRDELAAWLDAVKQGAKQAQETPRLGGDVLVVEDVPEVQRITVRMLEKSGIHAVAVSDGAEALQRLVAGERFKAVLLDLNLPRADGREVLTFMGVLSNAPPVVVFTSDDVEQVEAELKLLGARAVVGKSFQDGELVDVVRSAMDAAA